MTNEDMQKKMEFIVEQLADLAVRLQSLEHIATIHSGQIAEHSAQIGETTTQIGQLKDFLFRTVRIVEEQGRQTDDRINALIKVVERYFTNGGRN